MKKEKERRFSYWTNFGDYKGWGILNEKNRPLIKHWIICGNYIKINRRVIQTIEEYHKELEKISIDPDTFLFEHIEENSLNS